MSMCEVCKNRCTCDINGAEDDIGHFKKCPIADRGRFNLS